MRRLDEGFEDLPARLRPPMGPCHQEVHFAAQAAGGLGAHHFPADGRADAAHAGPDQPVVAAAHIKGVLDHCGQVLVMPVHGAVGLDQHIGVVNVTIAHLEIGAADHHAIAGGFRLQHVERRVIRRQRAAEQALVIDDAGGEELRDGDDLCPLRHRFVDQACRVVDVVGHVSDAALHLHGGNAGELRVVDGVGVGRGHGGAPWVIIA